MVARKLAAICVATIVIKVVHVQPRATDGYIGVGVMTASNLQFLCSGPARGHLGDWSLPIILLLAQFRATAKGTISATFSGQNGRCLLR